MTALPKADPGRRAREQATAYQSVFDSTFIDLDDGSTIEIPPHPDLRMLNDDRQEAYEELLFETESYDREPDVFIPEQHLDGGVTLPAETRQGQLKWPYRKNGELIKPPYRTRVVQVALGDEAYARLKANGLDAADVWKIWREQNERIINRGDADPKSNGSPSPVAKLPRGNS